MIHQLCRVVELLTIPLSQVLVPADGEALLAWAHKVLHNYLKVQVSLNSLWIFPANIECNFMDCVVESNFIFCCLSDYHLLHSEVLQGKKFVSKCNRYSLVSCMFSKPVTYIRVSLENLMIYGATCDRLQTLWQIK